MFWIDLIHCEVIIYYSAIDSNILSFEPSPVQHMSQKSILCRIHIADHIFSGQKIDHQLHVLPLQDNTGPSYCKAREYWTIMFPLESYSLDYTTIDHNIKYEPKCTYDLIFACIKHQAFFYQVSLPHYQESSFILSAMHRYKSLICLKKMFPLESFLPMFDIDLMWQTHLLFPESYATDTQVWHYIFMKIIITVF